MDLEIIIFPIQNGMSIHLPANTMANNSNPASSVTSDPDAKDEVGYITPASSRGPQRKTKSIAYVPNKHHMFPLC